MAMVDYKTDTLSVGGGGSSRRNNRPKPRKNTPAPSSNSNDNMLWDDGLRQWGSEAVAVGLGTMMTGAAVTQLDTPIPGPADVAGVAIGAGGAVIASAGAISFVAGSVGGFVDGIVN